MRFNRRGLKQARFGHTRARLAAALLAATAGVAMAQVQPAELPAGEPAWATPIAERNAAIAYYRTWMAHDKTLREMSMAMVEIEDIYAAEPGTTLGDLLAEHQNIINEIMQAGTIPHADWEMQFERGVEALLPHLAKMRISARLLAADAARHARDGNIDEAARRIAGMYHVAQHSTPDRVIISSLVGTAITALANAEVDKLLARGDLTSTARDTLLDAIERFDREDPFYARRSLAAEGEMMTAWVRDTFTGQTAGAEFLDAMVDMGGSGEGFSRKLTNPLFYADEQALRAQLRLMLAFYRDADTVWDAPDASDRFKLLSAAVQSGSYGSLGKLLVPAIGRFHEQTRKGEAQLRETAQRLAEAPVFDHADDDQAIGGGR